MRLLGRTAVALALGAAAAGVALAAPPAGPAPAGAPQVRGVVSLAAPEVSLPGVTVLARYRGISAAVVSGTPASLRALAHAPGVRGVSPDLTLTTAGDKADDGNGVYAWEGLAKAGDSGAGQPMAGAGVTVALLDTGVSDSEALDRSSGRLVDGVDTSRLAEGGDARTSGRFTDGYGHGTFLASLIAGGPVKGTGKRGLGVAPGARVVVVKVADSQGRTALSEVLAGLDWIAVQAPRIQLVTIALAHRRPSEQYGEDPLTVAVEHVQASGVAVVAAAGNERGEVGDPGLDPRVLTVGAADLAAPKKRPVVADFSGSAVVAGVRKPDVVASGVGVLGVLPPDSAIARGKSAAHPKRGLWRGTGTSQATAVTTGVAAQFLSTHPDVTLSQVKPSLRAAATALGARGGAGLVDLAATAVPATPQSTGEAGFDAASFRAAAWRGGDWRDLLDRSWSTTARASSWSASSWSASSWSSSSWTASSWSGWSASSWSASSWSASSWSASSWSASSWSASSWSASSWSTSSWSASSWSALQWTAE